MKITLDLTSDEQQALLDIVRDRHEDNIRTAEFGDEADYEGDSDPADVASLLDKLVAALRK